MESPIFEIAHLTVAYELKPVLYDISTQFQRNKLVAIIGPNGAGKSTLIKAALGLIPRITGEIRAFGEIFSGADHRIGYVPQRESVDWDFPVSALDVAAMGAYGRVGWFKKVPKGEIEFARHCLETVGLRDFADRQISQLSGGQQQRVFLARALAQKAELYFMDEPFSGVDAATEEAILEVLRGLRHEGKTVVAVHHDLQTVNQYFDDVVMLNLRKTADGPISEVFTEENLRKTYAGRLSVIEQIASAATKNHVDL